MTPLGCMLILLPLTNSMLNKNEAIEKPQSVSTCDLTKCDKEFMCLCQKVALASSYGNDWGDVSPSYLRNNYANDLQRSPSATICHSMVNTKQIDVKCLIPCAVMEQYIRASSGQDAIVCQKAVEEAQILETGEKILSDDNGPPCKSPSGTVHAGTCKTTTKADGSRNCPVPFLNNFCPGSATFKCCDPSSSSRL